MNDLMNNDDVVVPAVDPAVPVVPPVVVPLDDEEEVVDGAGAVGDSSDSDGEDLA